MIRQLFVSSYPQKQEAGKAGKETIRPVFDKVVKLKRLYKHHFRPHSSALLFSWGREIKSSHKSILSIIPTITKIWTSPDNHYQSTKISLISQPKFRQHHKDRNKKISNRFSFIPPFTVPGEMIVGRKCIKPCRYYSSG